jgi:hypothetical protein
MKAEYRKARQGHEYDRETYGAVKLGQAEAFQQERGG